MYLEYKIQSICWLIFEQLYLLLSLRYPDLVPIISLQVSCVLRGLAPTPAPWIGLQWSEPIWIIPCTQHRIPFKDVLVPKGLSVLCISPESIRTNSRTFILCYSTLFHLLIVEKKVCSSCPLHSTLDIVDSSADRQYKWG